MTRASPFRCVTLTGLTVATMLLASSCGSTVESAMPSVEPTASSRPIETNSATPATTPATQPTPLAGGFPSSINGMPVQTVAQAHDLIVAGELDGRAVAVAGFFNEAFLPCPGPDGYYSPFEDTCHYVAFTDLKEDARICSPNGGSCQRDTPGIPNLSPYGGEDLLESEMHSQVPWGEPFLVVLIGHVNDPRHWLCVDETSRQCTRAFVIDGVAWANGHELEPTAPEVWDSHLGRPLQPSMTIREVGEALGTGQQLLSAAPFVARDISSADPRFNLAGDDLVWLARSISNPEDHDQDSSDPTRAVTVSVVADANGQLLASKGLADSQYEPARVWLRGTTTEHDRQSNPPQDQYPFYRLELGGEAVSDGMISGSQHGFPDLTYYGPGGPLLVDAGAYDINSWWATREGSAVGDERSCSTAVTVTAGQELYLSADFGAAGPCTLNSFEPSELTEF